MKKLLSILLIVGMLMTILCINTGAADLTPAQLSEQKLRRADANKNGTYDLADAQVLLKAAAGISGDKAEYDVDGNGYTSIKDAILVLRQASGTGSVLTNAEAVELLNVKLNDVKKRDGALPGFTKETTASCSSMKITQKVEATGLAALVSGQLACTDLEYDKYVEKMTGMMNSSDLTADDKANIEALKQSAKEYRKPQTEKVTVAKGDYIQHFVNFPRDAIGVASEITASDISSLTFEMKNGNIVYTLKLPNKSYTSLTAYNQNPYAKVMNAVEFDTDSTLKRANLNNGLVVVTTDANTGAMKAVTYSYNYYSEIDAPPQSQSDSSLGSVTIKMTTKTTASFVEKVTF